MRDSFIYGQGRPDWFDDAVSENKIITRTNFPTTYNPYREGGYLWCVIHTSDGRKLLVEEGDTVIQEDDGSLNMKTTTMG